MTALTDILAAAGNVITAGIGWAGDVLSFITSNPIVYVPILFAFAGFGVGLLRRVFNW